MSKSDPLMDEWDKITYGIEPGELHPFTLGTSSRRVRKVSPVRQHQSYINEGDEDYAEKYQKDELKQAMLTAELSEEFSKVRIKGPGMSMLEGGSTVLGSDILEAESSEHLKKKLQAYKEFDFSQVNRNPLAIDTQKDEILNMLTKEAAIIIKGFTGCGKSTQVPQFILDDHQQKNLPCNIVVTQPRRIAAITIAQRVCRERNWPMSTVVGYQVAMDKMIQSDLTCLTYMTTGCLLAMLVARKSLAEYTHIIIDEVHERDEDTDLLLMIVRKFLYQTRCNTKVILMSATADASHFAQYFQTPVNRVFRPAPILEVDAPAPHQVRVFYLDDLKPLPFLSMFVPANALHEVPEPKISTDLYDVATRLIAALDEKREITRYGRNSKYDWLSTVRPAILVFLPGLGEIEMMHKFLNSHDDKLPNDRKNYWRILPLHSRITAEEQARVFQPAPPGYEHYRKIILSTNIAESSLTVPDTIYVVDFCLHKQLMTDPETNFCCLKTTWAPKSNCTQRKGRVGRVLEGVVYRMLWKSFYEEHLPEDVTPEILRCPLEQAILKTKVLDLGEPKALLSLVIDPPRLDNILTSITTLKEVGALFTTVKGKPTPFDGDLSYLGRIMSKLPMDVHLSKLIMLGYVFNVLEECIIMASGLASKNIFTAPYQKRLHAYQVKMTWSEASFSDPMTILNAFQTWKGLHRSEYFKRSGESEKAREKRWARDFNIQLRSIKDMDLMVDEIKHRLSSIGIEPAMGPNVRVLNESQKSLVLRVAIFGAFYPNYFSRDSFTGRIDEREAVRSLNGLDPYNTVRLAGFPLDQPPKAYVRQIKENMKEIFELLEEDTWDANISVDAQRVFIQFHQEGNPEQKKQITSSKVCLPVYLAVKLSKLGKPFMIRLMEKDKAERYVRHVEESAKKLLDSTFSDVESLASGRSGRSEVPYVLQIPPPRLPEMKELVISKLAVCHVEDPNKFWCQRIDEQSRRNYSHITQIIGTAGNRLKRWDIRVPIQKGQLVMAPFRAEPASNSHPEYFRAKVLSVQRAPPGNPPSADVLRVYFIDFGNATEVLSKDLKDVPEELMMFAPLAFECRLKGVGPRLINDLKGKWTQEAKDWFTQRTMDKSMDAKIFSVVDGITTLDFKPPNGTWEDSIATQFLRQNLADPVEEPYCSKMDNEERLVVQEAVSKSGVFTARYRQEQIKMKRTSAAELVAMEQYVPVMGGSCKMTEHILKGPFNPLEMKIYGKVQSLLGKAIRVEEDSVNAVLLDDQPGDAHERVLVAASVGTNQMGNRVTIRGTTFMPNIHGLPALLTLIFAPRVEFRSNEGRTRLNGAICGLGYDARLDQAVCPERDMEIAFDKEIDYEDVLNVNKIRFWLNTVLGAQSYTGQLQAPSKERIREVSHKTLTFLFEMLGRSRNDCEVIPSTHYKWNMIRPEHVLHADTPESEKESLIPMLSCVQLQLTS